MSYQVRDALTRLTLALPNGAATAYATPGIDLGALSTSGRNLADCELLLSAPALTTGQQPDAKTLIYSILIDTVDPIDASSTVMNLSVLTQTGAGGAGAAAATWRGKIPTVFSLASARIVGFRAIGSAAGDASAASATLELLV